MPVNFQQEIDKHFLKIADLIKTKLELKLKLELSGSVQASIIKQRELKPEYPYETIPLQLDLIKYYFDVYLVRERITALTNDPGFLELMYELTSILDHCNPDDTYFFYTQPIVRGSDQLTLFEFFKKLMSASLENIRNEMELFAISLSNLDPSLIIDSPMLKPVYEQHYVGPGLTFPRFRDALVNLLIKKSSGVVRSQLESYKRELDTQRVFTPAHIEQLKSIFSLRWNEIAGTNLDYTREQNGINWSWILVARFVVGANLIPDMDVYNVLMPTIKRTHWSSSREPLSRTPLSHCILSEDGTDLISLDESVQFYQQPTRDPRQQKLFYNCTVYPAVRFKAIEVERIENAAPRLHRYVNIIHNELIDTVSLPLKRSTVLMFTTLVNKSMRRGITDNELGDLYFQFGHKLGELPGECQARVLDKKPQNADILKVLSLQEVLFIRTTSDVQVGFCNKHGKYEQRRVENKNLKKILSFYDDGKYVVLTAHKDQLNEYLVQIGSRTRIDEELNRVYEHRVVLGGFNNSIRYILEQIARGEDVLAGCISESLDFLMKLVVDYIPNKTEFMFSDDAELAVENHKMRQNSAKRIFSDVFCTQGEPINRNLILMASLMTYRFPVEEPITHTMELWDLKNSTSDLVVKEIFDQLMACMEDEAQQDESTVDIMNTFIQPLMLQGGLSKLPAGTQHWFSIIQSEDFFTAFYDPKHLFLALEPFGESMHVFLDEILSTLLQSDNKAMQLVRINVKFKLFFNTLTEAVKIDVLTKLATTRREVTGALFYSKIFDYVSTRLVHKPLLTSKLPPGMVSPSMRPSWPLPFLFGKSPEQMLTEKLAELGKKQEWHKSSIEQVFKLITAATKAAQMGTHPYIARLKASVLAQSPTVSAASDRTYSSRSSSGLSNA